MEELNEESKEELKEEQLNELAMANKSRALANLDGLINDFSDLGAVIKELIKILNINFIILSSLLKLYCFFKETTNNNKLITTYREVLAQKNDAEAYEVVEVEMLVRGLDMYTSKENPFETR